MQSRRVVGMPWLNQGYPAFSMRTPLLTDLDSPPCPSHKCKRICFTYNFPPLDCFRNWFAKILITPPKLIGKLRCPSSYTRFVASVYETIINGNFEMPLFQIMFFQTRLERVRYHLPGSYREFLHRYLNGVDAGAHPAATYIFVPPPIIWTVRSPAIKRDFSQRGIDCLRPRINSKTIH